MEKASGNLLRIRPENTASSSATKRCPDCEAEITPIYIPLTGKWFMPVCECKIAQYRQEEAERIQRDRRARIDRLFKNSGLGPRFINCTFSSWEERKGTEYAYLVAVEYAKNIDKNIQEGRGFLLFGQPGNGKSHLAAAVVNKALNRGYTAIFERVPKLLAKIRSTYNEGSSITEEEIMSTLTQADLLVLDDAGAEKWTQWTEPTLYTIVDERYSHNKALIITTNSSLEELEEKIGERAMDRIIEMCEIVENRGFSYRKALAEKKSKGCAL